jgi:hypothetical protein
VAPEVGVGAGGTQDVVGYAYQELTLSISSPSLEIRSLRIPISRAVGGGHEPQVCSHRAALFEAVGIFQGEHERERPKRSKTQIAVFVAEIEPGPHRWSLSLCYHYPWADPPSWA